MAFVLDVSVAISWYLPDERDALAEMVFQRLRQETVWVPALWPVEVANALLMAERRRRIARVSRLQYLDDLAKLPLQRDHQCLELAPTTVSLLAESHGLTIYDAAYLELAMRKRVPLATFDRALIAAAKSEQVDILAMQ